MFVITCIFRMNVSWMKSFHLCPVYWERKLLLIYSDESADQLEPVFPVIPPTSFYSSQSSVLEEFRNIREEQDTEYNAMLENDLALENVCVHVYVIMGIVANK